MEKLQKKFNEKNGNITYKIFPVRGMNYSDSFHMELEVGDQEKVKKELNIAEDSNIIVTDDHGFNELTIEYDIEATMRFGNVGHLHISNENLLTMSRILNDIVDTYNLRGDQREYFKCQQCGAIIEMDQTPYDEPKIVYPIECLEEQGGCGRKGKLLRLKKEYVEKIRKEKSKLEK